MIGAMFPGWEDLRITAFEPNSGADAPQLIQFPAATTYAPQVWRFQNVGSVNFLNAVSQMSHGVDLTQPAYLHLHLSNDAIMVEGAIIGLFVALNVCTIGGVWGTEEIYWCSYTVPAGGIAAKTHIKTPDVPISAALQAKMGNSSAILISVFRDKDTVVATQNAGAVTETLNDEVWFLECDFHFFKYRGGSQNHAAPFA
ncbi:MAG: hypothetical protein WC505_06805 [Patescibacteria group bacterium]